MEKISGLVAVTDWRAKIKYEDREKVFMSILEKLRKSTTVYLPYDTYIGEITNHAREQEMKLFKTAKSKQQYYGGLTRILSGSENPWVIASNQDCPAGIIKKEEDFDSQPFPQMTNQPHQWVVHNRQNQKPAMPYSLLKPNILQSTPQPHEQLYGKKPNARHTNQNLGLHNQRCISPLLNSPCQPQGVHSRVPETHMNPEIITQHPKAVKLQPNENLSAKIQEVFMQRQSLGVPAVPNGNSNAEEWHGHALSEMRCLRRYLPLLKITFEKISKNSLQARQMEIMQKYEHHKNLLQIMIKFLESPEDRTVISRFTKDGFYRHLQCIRKNLKFILEKIAVSKQQPLRGQPSHTQSHINPVQRRDNVNPHFQLVTTTGSYDSSSPRAPQEIGTLSSEAGCIQKCMLQKKENSENIKQEFHSSWTPQNLTSTENFKASNRSGMCLEYHLNSKFSPQPLEASMPSKIAEQALPINPSATMYGIASPIPPSTIVLGKNPTNPTNPSKSERSQGCNSLKFNDSKTVIQTLSHEIRSSSTMTCQLAEPTNLGNKAQLSTETPHNRLLKAVESISNEALRVAVSEIRSIMEDRITEPWCCEKESYLSFQYECGSSSNLKRKINATTLNDMPSSCSVIDESESIVTSSYKKLKKMTDHALLEEMRKINNQFIETVLELDTDERFNRHWANAGTVLRLSYRAAAESKNSVPHSTNTLKLPVLSINLLIPRDYPDNYPIFMSKFDTAYCTEDDVLKGGMMREAGFLLSRYLDANHDHLSLEDYAKAWNECARSVVSDYAKRAGGGSFNSRYGTWEDCVAAA